MQVFMLEKHGFRAIACANETHFYRVEFYPNSPHFTWEKEAISELANWLKDQEKTDWDIPELMNFPSWKQKVEDEIESLSWEGQMEEREINLPEYWDLLSQVFFLAGLSTNEAVGALI